MLKKLIFVLLLGITFFGGIFVGRKNNLTLVGGNRVSSILSLIQSNYVDALNMDSINEQIIPIVLSQLDPHSSYLPAAESKAESEVLDGSFEGIGIQFNRLKDTVIVSRVIEGGGSERAGVQAGDRILKADTTSLLGKELSNERVMKTLKGKGGTVVSLDILREGKPLTLKVVRGPVPVSSIDASYMIGDKLYVRINRWGAITHQEFLDAYVQHADKTKGIIIDLRDNSGGYLETAVELTKEFLPKDRLIVYTEGHHYPREDYATRRDGTLKDIPLTVLVNEFSASASEIFAGAIQDHDRGTIIGRRTFGKGLVQRPFEGADGSMIRLTVARYYTPSGRSIQKKYKTGTDGAAAYAKDLEERFTHGELYNADSVAVADTTRYYTTGGRIVHGGGGITPDVFIARDSVGINSYYLRVAASGTLQRFAFDYADVHRKKLQSFKTADGLHQYLHLMGKKLLYDFVAYAQKHGVEPRSRYIEESSQLLLEQLHALIADNASLDSGIYYKFINLRSQELSTAISLLDNGKWRPQTTKTTTDEAKAKAKG